MKELPLISVIVPVYKVEKYLDRCLESITGQTYSNLEIILVDDGSPDQSGAICDAWAAKDSRIQVIHKQNAGAGAARNTALDRAGGALLAFVDSDDYIAPDMYSHLYELLQCGADIAECGYSETYGDDMVFGGGEETPVVYTPVDAMREHIRENAFCQLIWNKLYRRQVAEGIRFPTGGKIDDEYYTYRLLGNARKLVRSRKICYAYRQQENSVMHEGFSLKRVESLEAKLQRLEYLKEHMPQLVTEAKEEMVMACLYSMQSSLRALKGTERELAKQLIYSTMRKALPLPEREGRSKLRRVLLWMTQRNLVATSYLLNFLIWMHVLS